MLFRHAELDDIADGRITTVFRRWARPHAKPGSRHRTSAGVIIVAEVKVVDAAEISERDAREAGHDSRADLLRTLDRFGKGDIYRLRVAFGGADERVALREQAELTGEELEEIVARLDRMDAASRSGPWTRRALELIAEQPATLAAKLADQLDEETADFKRRVRRLKELGLTESLEVGYRLSRRGRALLQNLPRR